MLLLILKILFIVRVRGRKGERKGEKHRCVRDGTTQARALTGNRTGHFLVLRPSAQSTEPHQLQPGYVVKWGKKKQNSVSDMPTVCVEKRGAECRCISACSQIAKGPRAVETGCLWGSGEISLEEGLLLFILQSLWSFEPCESITYLANKTWLL